MIVGEIVITSNVEKIYSQQKDLIDRLSKKNKFFYLINCHNLIYKKKIIINKFCKNKKIIFYNPKSTKELNNFLNKNQFFLINNISPKFNHLKIHMLLNKKNIFQVSIDNLGILSSYYTDNWKSVNLNKKIYFLYIKKFSFFIYRLLILFGFIKTIDILYLAKKDVFQKYSLSFFRKLPFNKRYQKIVPTRLRQITINKKNQSEEFITYIDTNFNHGDMEMRNKSNSNKPKNLFLNNLRDYFFYLEKKLGKKIVLCLHPSSNKLEYQNKFKEFKIVKYKTEAYLLKSYLVLFTESSIINLAILMNKKIIHLLTKNLGAYFYEKSKNYSKNFNFVTHNLDKTRLPKNKSLINQLNLNVRNYQKSLNKLYFIGKKINPVYDLIVYEINLLKKDKTNF
jgi:hypothetical protein